MAEGIAGDPFEAAGRPILYDGDYMYLVNAAYPAFPPMVPKWITPEEAKAIWPAREPAPTTAAEALLLRPSRPAKEISRMMRGAMGPDGYPPPSSYEAYREWKDNSP